MTTFLIVISVLIFGGGFNLLLLDGLDLEDYYKLGEKKGCLAEIIIFVILFSLELWGAFKLNDYLESEAQKTRDTTYMIEMPNGLSCEGTYYSGKNDPIYVNCVDGRKYVVNGIEVKYKLYKGKRQ